MKAKAFSSSGSQVTATPSGKPSLTYTPRYRRPQHPQVSTVRVLSDVTRLLSAPPHVSSSPARAGWTSLVLATNGPPWPFHALDNPGNKGTEGKGGLQIEGALSAPHSWETGVIEVHVLCGRPGVRAVATSTTPHTNAPICFVRKQARRCPPPTPANTPSPTTPPFPGAALAGGDREGALDPLVLDCPPSPITTFLHQVSRRLGLQE